jgi:hypothetical protein
MLDAMAIGTFAYGLSAVYVRFMLCTWYPLYLLCTLYDACIAETPDMILLCLVCAVTDGKE